MVQIRQFHPDDAPALYQVFYSAIHQICQSDYTQAQLEAWAPLDYDQERWLNRMQGISPFVATVNGVIAGYADLQKDGYIDHFFVSGANPRQGVGRALMHKIEQQAHLWQLPELYSDVSLTAQPFFQAFGFQIVKEQDNEVRGVILRNARMQKVLQ